VTPSPARRSLSAIWGAKGPGGCPTRGLQAPGALADAGERHAGRWPEHRQLDEPALPGAVVLLAGGRNVRAPEPESPTSSHAGGGGFSGGSRLRPSHTHSHTTRRPPPGTSTVFDQGRRTHPRPGPPSQDSRGKTIEPPNGSSRRSSPPAPSCRLGTSLTPLVRRRPTVASDEPASPHGWLKSPALASRSSSRASHRPHPRSAHWGLEERAERVAWRRRTPRRGCVGTRSPFPLGAIARESRQELIASRLRCSSARARRRRLGRRLSAGPRDRRECARDDVCERS
jgi:hypothetical protein